MKVTIDTNKQHLKIMKSAIDNISFKKSYINKMTVSRGENPGVSSQQTISGNCFRNLQPTSDRAGALNSQSGGSLCPRQWAPLSGGR